jgi:transcriptional regulator with XRE-family HTH domain
MACHAAETQKAQLQRRNQELGSLLAEARQQQERSVSECAALLGTSRRRYRAIERGEVGVNASELEFLMHYLDIPATRIWHDVLPRTEVHQVVIQARPGERIQVTVDAMDERVALQE